MSKWVGRLVRFALNAATLVAAGLAAFELHDRLPQAVHGALFLSAAALGALLFAFSGHVYGKLDKILQDTEKYDFVRTQRAYRYVDALRHRLVLWVIAAAVCLIVSVAASYMLKDRAFADDRRVIVMGYVALTIVLLAGYRIIRGYLSLDKFRLELLKLMQGEQRRVDALRSMRPTDVLPDSSRAPVSVILPPRN